MPDGPNKNIPQTPAAIDPSRPEMIKRSPRLVIDAPEHLVYGQNLYDQAPFNGAVERLQNGLSLDESYADFYRIVLTKSLSNPDLTTSIYGWQRGMFERELIGANVMSILDDRHTPYKRLSPENRFWAKRIITGEILTLLEYPFIGEYVRNQTEPPQSAYSNSGVPYSYSHSGRFKFDEKSHPEIATKSYAKWLSDRVKREGRMLSLEVRSVIFAAEEISPVSAVRRSGHHKGWRRWAILKVSGAKS